MNNPMPSASSQNTWNGVPSYAQRIAAFNSDIPVRRTGADFYEKLLMKALADEMQPDSSGVSLLHLKRIAASVEKSFIESIVEDCAEKGLSPAQTRLIVRSRLQALGVAV